MEAVIEAGTEPVAPAAKPGELPSAATTLELVKNLYKNELGHPFELTEGQNEIFDAIFTKGQSVRRNRIHIKTYTQYGKSDVVSMAVLTRVSTFGEKWCIVAPSLPKAKIIMGYLIGHVFQNEYTMSRFKVEPGENAESIRRERSKNRLTFDVGDGKIGEVFVLSAESRLKSGDDVGNSLMGFGAPNLIEDEAALVSDESDAKAMRMVGGFTAFNEDFVVKIGNPFQRNHFLQAQEDPAYHKINIDYDRGIREGRLSKKFVEEMRLKPYFRVLYENKFPENDDLDARGWSQLLNEDDVEGALAEGVMMHVGEKRIGHDVARGGANFTVWAMRSMNYLEVLAKSHQDNLTEIAGQTLLFIKEHKVEPISVFIDDIGVGGGAVDPLHYQQIKVRGVNVGQAALESGRFVNIRAEAYWRLREWIKRGGKLCRCHKDDWIQLTKIKYKPDAKGRLRIMSKDEMRSMGVESPDVADAAMLSFVRPEHGDLTKRREDRLKKRKKQHRGRGLRLTMGGH